jgi:cytochrome c oxidase subunit 2
MIIAIALILVAVGTVVFHFMSPWWWTPIASNWGYIDDTIVLTFWITGVVFVAVILFMAYCCIRFRYRKDVRAEYLPENNKLEWWLTALTTVGVVAMLTPGLFVWNQFITVPDGAMEFEALGQQWSWSYRFPGKDGILGTTDPRNVTDDNPYGINPKDPDGQDDILVDGDELHLPLGRPVKALLRSLDVLHDFYVPEFRAKMDIIPGMITYFWLTPTRTGKFDILCFELCGVGHYAMRGSVVVEEKSAFEAWLKEQPTFAQSLAAARTNAEESVDLVLNKAPTESDKRGSTQEILTR